MHSPFLFRFYNEVIKKKKYLPEFAPVEQRRRVLLNDRKKISSEDPGAGSLVHDRGTRKVSDIAKHSLSSPRFCSLLYRLTRYVQPARILEIGTSFGISSAYIRMAAPEASFYTIEGSEEIAAIAQETFAQLGIPSSCLLKGTATDVLLKHVAATPLLDFVFIDAHHTQAATLQFFEILFPKLHPGSVVVLGDIHWSAGMEGAWKILADHEAVTLSIDIYAAGILFFDKGLRKETEILKL